VEARESSRHVVQRTPVEPISRSQDLAERGPGLNSLADFREVVGTVADALARYPVLARDLVGIADTDLSQVASADQHLVSTWHRLRFLGAQLVDLVDDMDPRREAIAGRDRGRVGFRTTWDSRKRLAPGA